MSSGDYFLSHIPLIRKITIHVLIKPGYFTYNDFDELMQQVQEILLTREHKIVGSFQGKAKFSTYLAVVVTNICREIRNKEHRQKVYRKVLVRISSFSELSDWFSRIRDTQLLPEEQIAIRETVWKLHLILKTFPRERTKLIFCLKVLNRTYVSLDEDVLQHLSNEEIEKINSSLDVLNITHIKLSRIVIFKHLTQIFEIIEKRSNSDDAIRKWIDYRVLEIIRLLNGNPPSSSFNQETFQYLFDYYIRNEQLFSPNLVYECI